jgi:hypothetical protein
MKIALVGAELEENLAIRYIWSSLEKAGHEVVQIVFNHEEATERAARELAQSGAELAGFSMVFTYRARGMVQAMLTTIIQPRQEVEIVLWFGQSGVLAGADLTGMQASSEKRNRFLISLFDHFSHGNEELAGKHVILSFKADELRQPTYMTEMIALPPKSVKPDKNK